MKRGFTLIELLAVILILGIIAIIAIPVVTNVIEDSKMNAAKVSSKNYMKALEDKMALDKLKGIDTLESGRYTIEEINNRYKNLINGKLPDDGYMIINNGKVDQAKVCTNGYITSYQNSTITIGDKCDIISTDIECFSYENYNDGIKITNYLCDGTNNNLEIKDVIIPSKINGKPVIYIENQAFYQKNLTSVIIPNTITKTGTYAFAENNLTSIKIPTSLTELNNLAFARNDIETVELHENLTKIGEQVFQENNLTSIVIPSSVNIIRKYSVEHNYSLTSVIFEDQSGWTICSNNHYTENNGVRTCTDGISVENVDLSNPETNATYLLTTYHGSVWIKN